MADLPEHGLTKDEVRNGLRQACAIAHGRGSRMSLLELCALVLEDGLPPRAERDRRLAEKLADDDAIDSATAEKLVASGKARWLGDNTTPSSSPELLDRRDAPDASA